MSSETTIDRTPPEGPALAIAIAEAVAARCEERARGARAFWFQAKSLGTTGHDELIERERANYVRAEALATEAAELAHRLNLQHVGAM